ncbi:hypothetical protein IWX78_000480 [Mycetocola sp. CAN_C7]
MPGTATAMMSIDRMDFQRDCFGADLTALVVERDADGPVVE